MAIRQFNQASQQYETPERSHVMGSRDEDYGVGGTGGIVGHIKDKYPNGVGGDVPPVGTTRWSDYLRKMYANGQATGYQGGGGYSPKQLEFQGFSDEYNKYRSDQQGRVERYMNDPRGYNDSEFAMMQGRGADAITAQGGGYRQMMKDAVSKGGFNSGSIYNSLDKSAQNTQSNIAGMQRDLAIQDMDVRRNQQQAGLQMGNQWAGQQSSDDRWLSEGQMSVDARNEANRANAINSANSRRDSWDRQQLALQNRIGEMDIEERRYNDDQAWRWRGYGDDNRYVNKPQDYV